jgi:flagellar export protein FliJ
MSERLIRTLDRLGDLKQQQVDDLRADMQRLGLLHDEAEQQLEAARSAQQGFVDDMRASSARGALDVSLMLQQRAYLSHLEQVQQRSEEQLDRIAAQTDEARAALEHAHREVEVMDKLLERRTEARDRALAGRQHADADALHLIKHRPSHTDHE